MTTYLSDDDFRALLVELRQPFEIADLEFRPLQKNKEGTRAQAAIYADPRTYMNRLDEVYPQWSCTFTTWGDKIICNLTLAGVTRSSTGEPDAQSEKSEIAGTAAEAQAFKRACTAFGLGRYLYEMGRQWGEYDGEKKQFTPAAIDDFRKKAKEVTSRLIGKPTASGKSANGKPPVTEKPPTIEKPPTHGKPTPNGKSAHDKVATDVQAPAAPAAADPTSVATVTAAPAAETPATPFQLTKEQADQFQASVKAICGEKTQGLLAEALRTVGLDRWGACTQEQWNILSFWLEQMEDQNQPYRLGANALAYIHKQLGGQEKT